MVYFSEFPDPSTVSNITFTEYLIELIDQYGDEEDPENGPLLKYSEFKLRIEETVQRLVQRGIKDGQTILCLTGNSLEYILLCLAAMKINAIILPINPAMKKYEIIKYFNGVDWIVVQEDYIEKTRETLDGSELLKNLINIDDLFSQEIDNPIPLGKGSEFDVENTAFILYSSGTTGPPKGVKISHRYLISHCEIGKSLIGLEEGKGIEIPRVKGVIHGVLPLFHIGGIGTLFIMLSRGTKIILNGKFNPDRFVKILREKEVSVAYVVPSVLPVLSSLPPDIDLPYLKIVYTGAAPLSNQDSMKFKERFPHVSLIQMYGLTEAGTLVFVSKRGGDPTKAGIAMPGVQFKIVDEDGNECPFDVPGDILLKTMTMANGYINGEKLPEWFMTGDVGSVDSEGVVTIVGRTKDMIKVRGWQVNPYELENAMKENIEGVEECAVVGVELGNSTLPHAFIVGTPDVDEVIQFVKDNFISYKHLAGVSIVDELPKTETGKLKRGCLVQITTVDDENVFPLPITDNDEDHATPILMSTSNTI